MKQVLQNFKTGALKVEKVPAPIVKPGHVLVRNHFSLISSGTEGGTVKLGKMSLLGKARARPEQVMKVINVARSEGVMTAYNAAMRSLDMPLPLGYCCAGEVIDVGAGVSDLEVGDLVACGGGGLANHAELVSIPRNLSVKVPEGVDLRHAAFCTLGSIAMQGVRISKATIGERVVVIGLGLVGLITAELLRAAGCEVYGIDMDESRVKYAIDGDFCSASTRKDPNLQAKIDEFTGGNGADSVIITAAAGDSNDPIALAGELARHKARVVVVGRTKMEAPRETFLFKELELCPSYAYGPGTGDPNYEENGNDYPIGYVRWTENRNMESFLQLISTGRIRVEPLISHDFSIDEAQKAFALITGETKDPEKLLIGAVFSYPIPEEKQRKQERISLETIDGFAGKSAGTVGIGVIGAGSYATNVMMPALSTLKNVKLSSIASASGVRAMALGKKYGFSACVSDASQVIEEKDVDCVFILSRHDSHAPLTIAALNAGKHVFVEKPLALSDSELEGVIEAQAHSGKNVMVGFNRRYARLAREMKAHFAGRTQPLSISYRANVGYRPPEHWLHHPEQGGGVILGEACHLIDYCCWLADSEPVEVRTDLLGPAAKLIPEDNAHINIRFADGSLATVTYVSNGSTTYTRERVEVHGEGKSAFLEDFGKLGLASGSGFKQKKDFFSVDKGFATEITEFVEACRSGKKLNELMKSQFQSSKATILAAKAFEASGENCEG